MKIKNDIIKLKELKILEEFLAPYFLPIILVIFSLFIPQVALNFSKWLDFLGLLLITVGAVYGLRPLIRILLDPKIKVKDARIKDKNAGLVAFNFIVLGFAMQLIDKILILSGLDGLLLYLPLTVFLTVIIFYSTLKKFRELKAI